MVQQIAPEIFYPESDGQPMGETEVHRRVIVDLIDVLDRWLAGRADAHVSGNLFIYYVKGDPAKVVCPDVFVAFGSHKRLVNIYRTWRDGPFPQLVIEVTSRSTRAEDEDHKLALYGRLGVLEYYLFDPHFDPAAEDGPSETAASAPVGTLKVYRRASPTVPFEPVATVAPGAVAHSALLGLGVLVRGQALRLVDEATGEILPTAQEQMYATAQAREAAEERALAAEAARQAEARARQAAEERARALATEVERLRAEQERRPEG
jgi:Uma2 family endonuclease